MCWSTIGAILGFGFMWLFCGVAAAQIQSYADLSGSDVAGVFVSIPMAIAAGAAAVACSWKVGREVAGLASDLNSLREERRRDREELRDDMERRHDENIRRFERLEERLDTPKD